jgi:hypothetical protein
VLIVATLFAELQTMELAWANWVILPQSPNTDTPIITVTSPTNNMTNYSGEIALYIMVEKPTSWNQTRYDPNVIAGISYVHYVLDGITSSLFDAEYYNPIPNDELPLISNFSKILTGLSNGMHTLKVIVYSQSQYAPEKGPFGDAMPPFYWQNTTTNSETIYFRVQKTNRQPSISPIPTALTPSPNPTPSLSPTTTRSSSPSTSPTLTPTLEPVIPLPGDNSPATLTILITILMAVVVVIAALIYFKRRG